MLDVVGSFSSLIAPRKKKVASDLYHKDEKLITAAEMLRVQKSDPNCLIIDCRTKAEFDRGHVDGALHIPVDEMRSRIAEIPKDKKLFVYCRSGFRAYLAVRILAGHNLDAVNVTGGMNAIKFAQQK